MDDCIKLAERKITAKLSLNARFQFAAWPDIESDVGFAHTHDMASDDEYEAEALADPPQIDLLAHLKSRATEMRAAGPLHGGVDGDGNCIPAALRRLAAGNAEVPDIGKPISVTENIRVRTYKDMEGPSGHPHARVLKRAVA